MISGRSSAVISLPCVTAYISPVQGPTEFLSYLLDPIQTPQLWHLILRTQIYYLTCTRDFACRIKITGLKTESLGDSSFGPNVVTWVLESSREKQNERDTAEEGNRGVIQGVRKSQTVMVSFEDGGRDQKQRM